MPRLILSTNNITLDDLSIIWEPNSDLYESELSKALRHKFLVAQDNTYLKNLKDVRIEDLQIQPQTSGWTLENQSDYYIPTEDLLVSPLAEERSQYEITVKIFNLSESDLRNKDCANDAVRLVLRKLGVEYIDLLITSFPRLINGETDYEDEDFSEEDIEKYIATWTALTLLKERGTVKKLGVADFNSNKLAGFLKRVRVRPEVNQLYVKKCCNVTPSLLELARLENIELLTHHDSRNILPNISFGGIHKQDRKTADLQSHYEQSRNNANNILSSQWVVKYTAVIRDRGVIEHKGYFAAMDLIESI